MPTKPTAIEHIPTPTDSPAELWLDATAQTIPNGHGVILIIVKRLKEQGIELPEGMGD